MQKCLPILLLVALSGCATYSRVDEDPHELGTLAVAPFHKRPIADIEGMPLDKATGAVIGGAAGAAMGGYVGWSLATIICISSMFTVGGAGCGGLAAATAAGAAVGGAVGATAAARSAEKDRAPYEKRQQQAEPSTEAFDIQRLLAVEFLSAASSLTKHQFIGDIVTSLSDDLHSNGSGQLAARGADTLIEIGLSSIRFEELGYLRFVGQARQLTLPEGSLHKAHDFEFVFLEAKTPEGWVENSGSAIKDALTRSLPYIGRRVAGELFLLSDARNSPHSLWSSNLSSVTTEQGPQLGWHLERPDDGKASRKNPPPVTAEVAVARVDESPPCLTWLARERGSARLNMDPVCLLRNPEQFVYRRSGIRREEHTLEVALESCKAYAWSVRLQFQAGGRTSYSEWARWMPLNVPCEKAARESL